MDGFSKAKLCYICYSLSFEYCVSFLQLTMINTITGNTFHLYSMLFGPKSMCQDSNNIHNFLNMQYSKFGLFVIFNLIISSAFANAEVQNNKTGRIIKGIKAVPNQFPYQVAIIEGQKRYHICGGSIYSKRAVVSAAHCFHGYKDGDHLRVFAGSIYMLSEESGTFNSRVEGVIVHPGYVRKTKTYQNDLAIAIVDIPFSFDYSNVKPVPLAIKTPPALTECEASGWGNTEHRDLSKYLLYVYLDLYTNNMCMDQNTFYKEGMICAYNEEGRDTGEGDSGGPLVCNGRLVGVVSFGIKKKTDDMFNLPATGGYAEVAYYREWIILNRSCPLTSVPFIVLFSSWIVSEMNTMFLKMWFDTVSLCYFLLNINI